MLHIFLKHKLGNNISINKLGIIIRPLTADERASIISRYDCTFFSKEAKRKLKLFDKMKNNQIPLPELSNIEFTDEEYRAGYIYRNLKLEEYPFNKNVLNKRLDKIAVIEFNEKINDYIENGLEDILISNIIKSLLLKNGASLEKLKNFAITSSKFNIFSDELLNSVDSILNYINKNCQQIFEVIDLKEEDFIIFDNFINVLTKDRIRDFVLIIECLFVKESSNSNSLLNYVSSLERLLVKYVNDNSYDIGKQLILKFGLCLSDNICLDETIEEKIKYIKYCYQIRSCIVHGNEKDLLDAPVKILKMSMNDIKELIGDSQTYKTRFINIWLADFFLENNIGIVIKEWLINPKRIEFLKNN